MFYEIILQIEFFFVILNFVPVLLLFLLLFLYGLVVFLTAGFSLSNCILVSLTISFLLFAILIRLLHFAERRGF